MNDSDTRPLPVIARVEAYLARRDEEGWGSPSKYLDHTKRMRGFYGWNDHPWSGLHSWCRICGAPSDGTEHRHPEYEEMVGTFTLLRDLGVGGVVIREAGHRLRHGDVFIEPHITVERSLGRPSELVGRTVPCLE